MANEDKIYDLEITQGELFYIEKCRAYAKERNVAAIVDDTVILSIGSNKVNKKFVKQLFTCVGSYRGSDMISYMSITYSLFAKLGEITLDGEQR